MKSFAFNYDEGDRESIQESVCDAEPKINGAVKNSTYSISMQKT